VTRRLRALRALAVLASAGALVAVPALAATAAPTISGSGTGTVIAALPPFGASPTANPSDAATDGTHVYVVGQDVNTVQVYSADGTPESTIDLSTGSAPTADVLSPDGSTLYVIQRSSSSLIIINLSTLAQQSFPIANSPTDIAISPDGATLYVSADGNSDVTSYNAATGAQIHHAAAGPYETPGHVAVSPDGTKVYQTLRDPLGGGSSGGIRVFDAATLTESTHTDIASATGLAVSPDGAHVYVSSQSSGLITELTAAGVTTGNSVTVASSSNTIAISPDGATLYVPNSGFLSSVDTATLTAHHETAPGYGPTGDVEKLVVSPDGTHIYSPGRFDGPDAHQVNPFVLTKLTVTAPAAVPLGAGSTDFIAQLATDSAPVPDYSADTVTIDVLQGSTVTATGSGSPNATTGALTVPIDLSTLAAGTYSVRATFTGPDGDIVATATGLVIGAGTALAATGVDGRTVLVMSLVAAALLLLGVTALLIVRRRDRRSA